MCDKCKELKTIIYQPGTGTKYTLVFGIISKIAAKDIGCKEGALFIAWVGKGSGVFSEDSCPEYVAEKLNLKKYMLDAEAIAQFARFYLSGTIWKLNGWGHCKKCGLPSYDGERYGCYCPRDYIKEESNV